jgi:aminoglycoside phosphotransferase (APT) family kinase protein
MLLAYPQILAPALVAEGHLFGDGQVTARDWPWPYLILRRLDGAAWVDAALEVAGKATVARQLGSAIRRLHALPPPLDPIWQRDWLAELRVTCVERHRGWGLLPAHLIDQIDAYLAPPSPERRVVHADLHEDHVFTRDGQLVGLIDWGDAFLADPFYELPALHLGTFRGDRRLLAAFLDGYGWRRDADFAHRAMTMALVHEFKVLDVVPALFELDAIRTLDELAQPLWGPP